jgi:hypothetical protein
MGKHSFPADEPVEPDGLDTPVGRRFPPPSARVPQADNSWQGRRRRDDGGRREVSRGAIVVLATLVLLVGGIILWRFFGDALSKRSADAAEQCIGGTDTVAVVADPSIAEPVARLAESFNSDADPVGDKCVKVVVTPADSERVLRGLSSVWPGELGPQPAMWLPASSIQSARLQAAAGKQIVSDDRSLVTSPVVLAVRPQVKNQLAQNGWAALPNLQNDPAASLRLAVPAVGAADANLLAAEAIATASAPPNAPPTEGLDAVSALLTGQPRLPTNTAQTAWDALVAPGDLAAAAVRSVVLTEQQLFARAAGVQNAADKVAEWVPRGPAAVADYPTVLLSGPWLSEEQLAAASEFTRFIRKPDQLAELAKAGFRVPDANRPSSDVVGFPALGPPLVVGDAELRSALAATVAPATAATTSVMLDLSVAGVAEPLKDRLLALPPTAAVGLWTFDRLAGNTAVPLGPLSQDVGGQPRSAALAAVLDGLSSTRGAGKSFTTLRLVYDDALAKFRPGQPNSVLVITGGGHSDRSLDGQGLQDYVKSAVDRDRPVMINVIDVGDDPDRADWEAVVQISGGTYQSVPPDSPALMAAIARAIS